MVPMFFAVVRFQPTLLAFTRSDLHLAGAEAGGGVSTHAPRVHEERHSQGVAEVRPTPFQPTLLAFTRSDVKWETALSSEDALQPTLLAFTRSDLHFAHVVPPNEFQPTLLAFTRSDRGTDMAKIPQDRFQPTLLAFTRSDCARLGSPSREVAVSTHAPRVHEERLAVTCDTHADEQFQPTLLAFTRSDLMGTSNEIRFTSFNPRSSRSRGATGFGKALHLLSGVSTHAPRVHEERRPASLRRRERAPVSTHAPRVHEERRRRGARDDAWRGFNPRSSRSRGATGTRRRKRYGYAFQPTLLAFTRSDTVTSPRRGSRYRFNPRSSRSRGATPREASTSERPNSFNPRSLRSRGATARHGPLKPVPVVSTHAPRVHEERLPSGGVAVRAAVSTHAPRVHEERPLVVVDSGHGERFQPTLLAFTRSDDAERRIQGGQVMFQPTLLAFTRSDSQHGRPVDLQGPVSTHAPRVHEERLVGLGAHQCVGVFQPTLLAFTRSDGARWTSGRTCRCFNPRSSRSRGATSETLARGRCSGFNPRSSRSRGATGNLIQPKQSNRFQPTLLAFTRSDLLERVHVGGDAVSTHAPRVHEERPSASPACSRTSSFNPRSSRSRGATLLASALGDAVAFQPTLLAFTRSDLGHLRHTGEVPVSTHAPRVHEERPPTTRRRGPRQSFNPRSSRSRGATSAS